MASKEADNHEGAKPETKAKPRAKAKTASAPARTTLAQDLAHVFAAHKVKMSPAASAAVAAVCGAHCPAE